MVILLEINQQLIDGLAKIGLSQNQAKVYITSLVLGEEASAYTLAKESKVPRSKIYEVIESLVKMGFFAEIPSDQGADLYKALTPDKTIDMKITDITTTINDVKKEITILLEDYKGRVSEPPILIHNNVNALLNELDSGEFIEAWIDNNLKIAMELKQVLIKKKCTIHTITGTRPLSFILGNIDSFFIRGRNGSFFIIKFSNRIIQQILGLVEETKPEVREAISRESGIKILRETAIINVEDKIKLVIPGYDLKTERVLFWGTVEFAEGVFKSNNPCDCFITENRILLSADDGRVFARALKFVNKIKQIDSQLDITLSKVGGTEILKIRSIPYVPIIGNLLEFILKTI